MNRFFQRSVGLAVILVVLLAAALLTWGIVVTDPPSFWHPVHLTLAGVWQVMYSAELPNVGIMAAAVGIALLMVLFVVVGERVVASRYRRAGSEVTKLTLAPRAVMERTRGVFGGPVTVTVLIPAHNEERSLPATLVSLTKQTTPPDRIIVVADNCTDRTVEVAKAHGVDVFETVGNTTSSKTSTTEQGMLRATMCCEQYRRSGCRCRARPTSWAGSAATSSPCCFPRRMPTMLLPSC